MLYKVGGNHPGRGEIEFNDTQFEDSNGVVNLKSVVSSSYALLTDIKALGTNGGTFTAGSWTRRDINTTKIDNDNITVLNPVTSLITLEAGTYKIFVNAPFSGTSVSKIRLYNNTSSVVIAEGLNAWESAGSSVIYAVLPYQFELLAQADISIEHFCNTTKTFTGFGRATNIGTEEQYTTIEIWKV